MLLHCKPEKVISAKDAATLIQLHLRDAQPHDQDKEHLWAMGLDSRSNVKFIDLVSVGTLDSNLAHAREIFRMAVSMSAKSIILVHNHPSGDIRFSKSDIAITLDLRRSGEILRIPLIDHVVITHDQFNSMADQDLL